MERPWLVDLNSPPPLEGDGANEATTDLNPPADAPAGPPAAAPAPLDTPFRDPLILDALRREGFPAGSPFPDWAQTLVTLRGGHEQVFGSHDWGITGEPPPGRPLDHRGSLKEWDLLTRGELHQVRSTGERGFSLGIEAGVRLLKWPNRRFPFIAAWQQILKIVMQRRRH